MYRKMLCVRVNVADAKHRRTAKLPRNLGMSFTDSGESMYSPLDSESSFKATCGAPVAIIPFPIGDCAEKRAHSAMSRRFQGAGSPGGKRC